MKIKRYIIAIFLYHCCSPPSYGQVQENAIPFSVTEDLPPIANFEDLPAIDSAFCIDEAESLHKLTKFACPIVTDFDPENSGEWTETSKGKVWRMGIRSARAYSVYLSMHFVLSPGTRMFVYAPGYQDFRGAFTSRNNNPSKVLSTAPVQGDQLIIELNFPPSHSSFDDIKITRVYHDYFDIYKNAAVPGLKSLRHSGCSEEINCTNGRYWQTEKRAVCKIISNGFFGTGTLVGNTSGSSTPYVISANHLISSAEIAAEALFLFNYETTGCNDDLATNTGSVSGATLVSTTDQRLDFALMKLNDTPPPSYQTFYAGWDASNSNPQLGTCIHHPFGGTKQIAIDYHPLLNEDIGQGFDANSTWKVRHWELGTTEQGSSGAPLFDEEHRIVGTLTGGRSTCGYTRDDFFTKFGAAWDTYPSPYNQLKYWLDSIQTGQLVLDGYDPYGFNVEYCDTAWNFSSHDKLGLSNANLDWGWVSGHNSAGYTEFAERYEPAGGLQINGVFLNVAKAYASHPLAHIELKVWDGDLYPEKESYSKLLFINDFQSGKVNYVALDTVLKKSGTFFIGYKINYNTVSDTFALYHAVDRGYSRPSTMYEYKEAWSQSREPMAFGMATSLGLGISGCYGKALDPATSELNIYPNPCVNSVTLDIPGGVPVHEVKCFDSSGRFVYVDLKQTEAGSKLYFDLPPGIYYLKIITLKKSFVSRIVVLAG